MKIPKVINYCWFGKNRFSELEIKCIESWHKFCPDYEIVQWNEDNFDVNSNKYCREAFEAKKYAFVSDYARMKVIFENGGIYLDTDVELIKPIDDLIEKGSYIGVESNGLINSGLGFAAFKHNNCIGDMLSMYDNLSFLMDNGKYNKTPCTIYNTYSLLKRGYKINESNRVQKLDEIIIYPEEYLSPMNYETKEIKITDNTYSIHHYSGSWLQKNKYKTYIKKLFPKKILMVIQRRRIARLLKTIG